MADENINLISIEELIKKAKKAGVNFGKADPYNRLRYYTKISLLPHMERRKAKNGDIKAFYPADSLDRLIRIEDLKLKGMANEDIIELFEKEANSPKKAFAQIFSKTNLGLLAAAAIVLIALLHQRGLINLGAESTNTIPTPDTVNASNSLQIVDSGKFYIRAGKEKTFVRTRAVNDLSQIQIAFKDAITPATNYYIETKVPEEGFVLSLDAQIGQDAEFSWWITQNQ